MESILNLDRILFYMINKGYSSPALDELMLFLSGIYPWIFLFLGVISWGLYKYRYKFLKIIFVLVALVSLTDVLAYRLLKPNLARHRPCIELKDVRMIKSCGGEFGFPSNHSANALVIAFFLHLYYRRWRLTAFLCAFALLVGISRIYLGAHYPLDILAGYCLGATVASCAYVFGRKLRSFQ